MLEGLITTMRIISGSARGTKLYTLEGMDTRPTLDRVKESLFNILQNEIQNCVFLDVFAGSGAIGLEAASRGAKKVYMCENSRNAIQIVHKNIEKTHLSEKIVLYEESFEKMLSNHISEKLDIVYIDPPYKTKYAIDTIKILRQRDLLKASTILAVETDRKNVIKEIEQLDNISIFDIRKYGRASIIFARMTN